MLTVLFVLAAAGAVHSPLDFEVSLGSSIEDDDADLDVDWIALANQRQAEVMAQARVLREELTAPELTAPLPTLPPPQPRRAPQAPIGTPQAPIGSQRAPIGTPNRQRQESAC